MTNRPTLVLWLLALAMFLVVLDGSIVNVALPAIKSGLHFSTAALQWVLTAYVLTNGGFLMLGGRLADLYGRRLILIIGITGFVACSLLIGLASSGPLLIGLRALQGLAGALMAPAALSILLATFPEGHERNRALSVWSIVASGGAAAGVFLGGILTQYLGWRWCFFVNVPVGLAAIYLIRRYVPAHVQESRDHHLDVPGAILVTSGLMALVYGLTNAAMSGWTSAVTLGSLVASAALLAAFVYNETRARHPLVPLSIFRLRNVTGGNLMMLPIVAGAFGMFFFCSLYLQNILHYSPSVTGLAFLPIPVVIGLCSYQAPRLLNTMGYHKPLLIGTGLIVIGTFLLSRLGLDVNYFTQLLPIFLLLAVGFGLSFVAISVAATTGVPGDESGLASGLINTSQQVGGALGLAILAVVAATTTAAAVHAGPEAVMLGYQRAFLTSSLLSLIAWLIGFFVIRPDSV
jgi:EmrB/QacA subfamily drug resistance transporter